jgi:hypothetical protein
MLLGLTAALSPRKKLNAYKQNIGPDFWNQHTANRRVFSGSAAKV